MFFVASRSAVLGRSLSAFVAFRCVAASLLAVAILVSVGCGGGERVVFRSTSEFEDVVVTEDRSGVRTLRFGVRGAPQSRFDPSRPDSLLLSYVRATMIGLAYLEDPRRVLVVGLGGGSIPRALHRWYPEAIIDVVELDPVVVEVAKAWFGVEEDSRLRLEVADGRSFVEAAGVRGDAPYDLVVLDAFDEDSIPKALTTREFLDAVETVLAVDGRVLANLWSGGGGEPYRSMLTTYQAVFPQLAIFAVPDRGNRILVAGREPAPPSAVLRERVLALQERVGDLGLLPLLSSGTLWGEEEDFGGSILVDD